MRTEASAVSTTADIFMTMIFAMSFLFSPSSAQGKSSAAAECYEIEFGGAKDLRPRGQKASD
jgi:hypothetical protein